MAGLPSANGNIPEEARPRHEEQQPNGLTSRPNGSEKPVTRHEPTSETNSPPDGTTLAPGPSTTEPAQQQKQQQPPPARKPPPKRNKRKGPSYAQLHSKPLPLSTHPLPAFQPANPLSLLRLCYIYLSHLLSPPCSHAPTPYLGAFSPETRSIHVTDPSHVRALWEMGFFGKGSLSRSEPSWLEREKARLKAERMGGGAVGSAEEATRARREERRLFKMERARGERERIERQRAVEAGRMSREEASALEAVADGKTRVELGGGGEDVAREEEGARTNAHRPEVVESTATIGRVPDAEILEPASVRPEEPPLPNGSATAPPNTTSRPAADVGDADELEEAEPGIANQEHLQLTLEEAFFLSYALGVLHITLPDPPSAVSASTAPPSALALLTLFAAHSSFPPATHPATTPPPPHHQQSLPALSIPKPSIAINSHVLHARAVSHAITAAPHIKDPTASALAVPADAPPSILSPSYSPLQSTPTQPPVQLLEPDNRFLLNYVVYHHFRSLGWVVRPGVKFAVDYLLYNRGPVFSHAEFGVLIMPSYTDPYWSTDKGRGERRVKGEKDWWWLHCVNRVQSQVRKTLVLCYVDVPPPLVASEGVDGEVVGVKELLGRYKVREFVVRRWLANRSRD